MTDAPAARSSGAPPPSPSLLRLAAPLMLSFTLRSLLTAVDLPFGARLGDAAVAAMGLTFTLEFAFLASWVGLSSAMTSHLSRAMGERREDHIERVKRATTWLVVGLALALVAASVVVWAVSPRLGLDPAVAANFRIYAPTILAGAGVFGFWSVIPDSIVKAHHDTRSTMVAGILSGLLNVVLNTLFALVLEWGIFGLALATNLARLGGLSYALWRARALEGARRREWAAPSLDPGPPPAPRPGSHPLDRPYRALLGLAVPTALAQALLGLELAVANGVLARFPDATPAIAAYAVFHRVTIMLMMPVLATGVAVVPFVARAAGAGRRDEVRRGLRQALLFVAGYALLVAAPLSILLGPLVARLLGDAPATEALAAFALQVGTPLAVLVSGLSQICRPAFEALQRGVPGLLVALLRYVVLSPALALLGAHLAQRAGHAPFHGVVAGVVLAAAASSAIFLGWLSRVIRRSG